MKNKEILSESNRLFDLAVEKLGLDKNLSSFLSVPYREIKLEIPVKLQDSQFALLNAYRIQYNGARGPYYGGITLSPDMDANTVSLMAGRNVWKTALMNIPFGGAYGGIAIDINNIDIESLHVLLRKYIDRVSSLIGPYKDVITQGLNVDDKLMACIMDEYTKKNGYAPAAVVGKPEILGGTVGRPTALVSSSYYLLDLVSKNIQIQVHGQSLALSTTPELAIAFIDYLNYLGCNLIAIGDSVGAVFNSNGFDMVDLRSYIYENKKIYDYPEGDKIASSDLVKVDCDVLFLGQDSTIIDVSNVQDVKANIVIELSDALISLDSEPLLFDKGVTVIPDMLVTAGVSIVDYFEWIQNIQQFKWDYDQVNEEMAKYINEGFKLVSALSVEHGVSYRMASYMAGIIKVAEATRLRGLVVF